MADQDIEAYCSINFAIIILKAALSAMGSPIYFLKNRELTNINFKYRPNWDMAEVKESG